MTTVLVELLATESSLDFGELRIVRSIDRPHERVFLWDGPPPAPTTGHQGLAPVTLQGHIQGHQVYGEAVPAGVWLHEAQPPPELMPLVVVRLLEALSVLHRAHQVHGAVTPERVVIGHEGQVVLVGRGRRGGRPGLDSVGAMSMLADAEEQTLPGEDPLVAAEILSKVIEPGHAERLAAWARAQPADAEPEVVQTMVITLGGDPDDHGADEVVPDIGPDLSSGDGLLERWMPAGTSSFSEHTAEVTDGDGGDVQRIALALWSRLGAASASPPADRFDAVIGTASEGIRALVEHEPLGGLPAPLHGDPGDYLRPSPQPSEEPTLAFTFQPAAPSIDEEEATAVLDPSSLETADPTSSRWTGVEVVLVVAVLAGIAWVILTAMGL